MLGLCLAPAAVHADSGTAPALRGGATSPADAKPTASTRTAFELGLNAIVPLQGYADRQLGAGIEAGVSVLFERALVVSALGLRQAIGSGDDTFTHVPFELSVGYLISDGDNTPFIGGGVGLHYLFERVYVSKTIGTVLRSTSSDVIEDSTVGASLFARAGVLLLRAQSFSWLLAADYAITFADFQERSSEHAVRINAIVLVGGR